MKKKKRCKLFCRPGPMTIVMKMAKEKIARGLLSLQLFYDGVGGHRTEDSGKWKEKEKRDGNRKQCKIMKIHICARTLGGKFAMLQVLLATAGGKQSRATHPKFACVNGMRRKNNIGNCLESIFAGCLLDLRPES